MKGRFNQFFLALALVTLLATTISTLIVYTVAERSYRSRVESLSLSLLRQTMTVFETAHSSLVANLFLLYNDTTLRPMLRAKKPTTSTVLRAAQEVDESLVSAPYVETVLAYNSWADTFYSTSDGLMEATETLQLPIRSILGNITGYQLYNYIPMARDMSDAPSESPTLAVVVGDRPYRGTQMASSIIALLDERSLRRTIIGDSPSVSSEGTIIADRSGVIISHPDARRFGSSLADDPSLAPVVDQDDRSGWMTTRRGNEDYLTAYVRNSTVGWLFVRQTSVGELLSDLRTARNTIVLIVLLMLVSLLLWDYFLSKLLSRRIKALAKQARTLNTQQAALDDQAPGAIREGELDEVESALQFARERLDLLEAGERVSQENAVRSVLRRFLESPLEPEFDTGIEQQSRGSLKDARFILVLVSVDRYRQILLKRGRTHVDRMRRRAAKSFQNSTEDRCFTFMLRPDEVLVLREVQLPWPSTQTVQEWSTLVNEGSGSFSVAYAAKAVAIEDLSEMYEGLQASIVERFFSGHGTVIEYAGEMWPSSRYKEYPPSAIDRLIQHTLLGEYKEAMGEFDRAFSALAGDPTAAGLLARLLVTSLAREVRSRHGDDVEFPPEFKKLQSFGDYADTLEELRRIIGHTVYHLSRQMDPSTVRRHRLVVDGALRIIEEEYPDTSLCDDTIAERVGVSVQHVRALFKQYRGTSLAKEITHLRLQESRRLLLTTRLPAKDVAVTVGFGSANYFLTLFKKEYGMSPTSYRRRHRDTLDG